LGQEWSCGKERLVEYNFLEMGSPVGGDRAKFFCLRKSVGEKYGLLGIDPGGAVVSEFLSIVLGLWPLDFFKCSSPLWGLTEVPSQQIRQVPLFWIALATNNEGNRKL